jgi:preprotein translocase subunit YajC
VSTHLLFLLQDAPAAGPAGGGLYMLVFQVLAIGGVFYFLILRPQARAKKQHAELLTQLKRNDEVMTAGGLVGKVRDIKEIDANGTQETRVTIESGTATVVVERSRIIRIGGSAPAAPAA